MDVSFYQYFPCVLRKALQSHTVEFPKELKVDFEKFSAYRVITRKNGEQLELLSEDFLSQIELINKGKFIKGVDSSNIEYYSCSFFLDKEKLENVMKLPRKTKYIIYGELKSDNGVVSIDNMSKHINLWLFDCQLDKITTQFEVIQNE